jgi:hypothetical protein
MNDLRQHLISKCRSIALIPCDDRPGKLFEGLQHCRSAIFIAQKSHQKRSLVYSTTHYNRWATEIRNVLLLNLSFTQATDCNIFQNQFPKISSKQLHSVFGKIFGGNRKPLSYLVCPESTDNFIFYQEATGYWAKATIRLPYYSKNGQVGAPAHGRYLYFEKASTAHAISAVLNSSLFYSYFIAYGDCFHLSDKLVTCFPLELEIQTNQKLIKINEKLVDDLIRNASNKIISTKDGDTIEYAEFNVSESTPIIDEIDHVLAQHYGFTEEELDFIINYDIKYRMGRDAESEDE